MRRRLATLLSAASLLLCAATVALWAAGVDRPRVGDGWRYAGNRYALSLSPGGATLLGPPPGALDPAARQVVDALAADLRDDRGELRYDGYTFSQYGVDVHAGPADRALRGQPPGTCDAAARMLLSALEDPSLCAKAHAYLLRLPAWERLLIDAEVGFRYAETAQPGRWHGVYGGLPVRLVEDRPREDAGSWGDHMWGAVRVSTPGDVAAVRERWHARLDVPLLRVGYPAAAAALFVLPMGWTLSCVARAVRCRRRRSAARCAACGYDLRASPGRCPECGAAPAGGRPEPEGT